MSDHSGPPPFRWGPLLVPAYGPSLLSSLGVGALLPIVPLSATAMGGSVGAAAAVVAMISAGLLCGDLPAGALAARFGERRALVVAGLVDAAAMVLAFTAESLLVLGAAMFVVGMAAAVFGLARHAFFTVAVPLEQRARALSSLGGVARVGAFIGPLVGAGVVAIGDLRAVYLLAAATGLTATALAASTRDLTADDPPGAPASTGPGPGPLGVARDHRRVLRTVGVGVLLLTAARAARETIVPLWAESQHLDAVTISLIVGVAAGLELLLVYPGGAAMDRFGRLAVGVPATAAIGLGLALLPLTQSATTIAVVAAVMGMGNGLSSGLVMTLGSDAAPAVGRSQFLGVWRLISDVGRVGGPGLIAGITLVAPLAVASLTLAGVSLLGAAWLDHHSPRRQRRRARRA